MQAELVELDEILVAGLAVRSPKRALGQLYDSGLDKAWSAVLKQQISGPLASVYIDHAPEINSYYTQIVGYRCSSLNDVARGHVVSRIPSGIYAKFSAVGRFPAVFESVQEQLQEAVAGGLRRTFTGDYEFYPHAFGIDLYVPVAAA